MTAMSHIFVRLLRDDQLQSQIGQKQTAAEHLRTIASGWLQSVKSDGFSQEVRTGFALYSPFDAMTTTPALFALESTYVCPGFH